MFLFFVLFVSAYSLPLGRPPHDPFGLLGTRTLGEGSLILSRGNDTTGTPGASQGWTSSPNGRGTIDIIWSCFLTIFLCGWTTICVNVPPLGASQLGNFWRKLLVFFEALTGPEFIFHTALGQYVSARLSVKEFGDAGFDGWTTRHGFFADMGGFVLHPSDFVPFPLTVSQLHYLVTHGYVDFGDVLLTKSEIEDKNKFDTLARIITVLQLFWFVINVLARAALGMAITTLELSTAAFIFCTLFTYFCWRHKPQDVSEPVIIKPNVKLAEILVQAGPAAARPYSHTPLDFAKRKAHVFEYMWRYTFNVVKFVNIHFHPVERPITKIWDDQFFDLPPLANALLALVQLGFAAIHLLAWNFHFPSSVERLLWRIFSIYITCSVVCTWAALYWAFEAWPRIVGWLEDRQTTKRSLLSRMYSWWRSSMPCRLLGRISEAFRKGSFNRNLDQTVPLFAAVTIPLGGLYCCARTYIIVEDVINLRSLPTSTYDSVDWNAFLPHF